MSKGMEMGKSIPPPATFVYSSKQVPLAASEDLPETVFHLFTSKGKIKGLGFGFGGTWSGSCKLIVKLKTTEVFHVDTGAWPLTGFNIIFPETAADAGDYLTVKVEKSGAGFPLVPFSFFLPIEPG